MSFLPSESRQPSVLVCGVSRTLAAPGGSTDGVRYNRGTMETAADAEKRRWERETLQSSLKQSPERAASLTTISGRPVDRLYTADDLPGTDGGWRPPDPGVYPYTRGIHASGYRGRLWTMRQFAGFGTPEDTNRRYRALL